MLVLCCSSFLALFSRDREWVVLFFSLSLAAIKRAMGDATGPSRAPLVSLLFRLRSLRSNKGLNFRPRIGDISTVSLLVSELFTFRSCGDIRGGVERGLATTGCAETFLVSWFDAGGEGGEGCVVCKFSFNACASLETGFVGVETFPSTRARTGLDSTDPESSRSNICLGIWSGLLYPLRIECWGTVKSFAVFRGLKVERVGVCSGGGGAGVCGGRSRLDMEDSLMGFWGGALLVVCCFSVGGCAGAKFGISGILAGDELRMDEAEQEEPVDGGFGGAIGGGFKRTRSSSIEGAIGMGFCA